jgi:hypothetical protein
MQQNCTVVLVPDYFIVNGEQASNDPVLPLQENSDPLDAAFDILVLRQPNGIVTMLETCSMRV